MCVMVLVEASNLVVLLNDNTIISIIMDCLAIMIISEFSDHFFTTVKHMPVGNLISEKQINFGDTERELSKMLRIETTTSSHASRQIKGNYRRTKGNLLRAAERAEYDLVD